MVDIAVVGLSMGLKLEDFENLDLAYAPPFSTAIHPFVQAVYVLENKLSGAMQSMTPAQYAAGAAEGYTVIDVNPQPTIRGASSWTSPKWMGHRRHWQGGEAAAGVRPGQAGLLPAEPAEVLRL